MSATLDHDWFPRPLPANVVLGERCWLHSSFAFVHYQSRRPCGLRVGDDTGLYKGTFFDLGPDGEVEIGRYCTIVGAIINTNRRLVIGDYALVSHGVVIADSACATPDGNTSKDMNGEPIVVGPNSWVAARATLLAGANIGEGAIVGAGAVVDFEVPPFSLVAGNPAVVVRRDVRDRALAARGGNQSG